MKWYIFNNQDQPLLYQGKIVEFDSQEAAEIFMIGYVKEENYVEFCEANGITFRLLEVKDELGDGTINLTNEQIFFVDELEGEDVDNA